MAESWTTTSQSEVGGTQAGDTHPVLSSTRKGSSPEMAGSGELLLPLSMATTCASKRDANTPMTTNHRKAILHVRLSWHKSKADNKAKMNDWDRPNRAVPMGRLKLEKKKRKLGPTDRPIGVSTDHDPTQARGQGLLDHRKECEQPHHTARALSMRSSRVVLGDKTINQQKKVASSKNHWRHENICMLESLGKRGR